MLGPRRVSGWTCRLGLQALRLAWGPVGTLFTRWELLRRLCVWLCRAQYGVLPKDDVRASATPQLTVAACLMGSAADMIECRDMPDQYADIEHAIEPMSGLVNASPLNAFANRSTLLCGRWERSVIVTRIERVSIN